MMRDVQKVTPNPRVKAMTPGAHPAHGHDSIFTPVLTKTPSNENGQMYLEAWDEDSPRLPMANGRPKRAAPTTLVHIWYPTCTAASTGS